MKIDNLQSYKWDYSKLVPYSNSKIFIKGKNYKIDNGSFYKIDNLKQIKYIDNQKLTDKYIYKVRNADNNNEEIYIKLTFYQMLKFYLSTMFLLDCWNFIKYILSFLLWLISSFLNISFSQERYIENHTITFDVISVLEIPEKSFWRGELVYKNDKIWVENWKNDSGQVKKLFLGKIKNFPNYYILIFQNCSFVSPEHISIKITGYDKIAMHAIPTNILYGYSYFIFPKEDISCIRKNVVVYSENGRDCDKLKILKEDVFEIINYCNSRRYIRNTKKTNEYGKNYHFLNRTYSPYFSIVKYKNVIRFNCSYFQLNSTENSEVYLESAYYEISENLWDNFIKTAELGECIGFICGNNLWK